MKKSSFQSVITWKSLNPEHPDYELPILKKDTVLNEQSDWTNTHNHFGSDLLLLLVNVLGEQQVTMGYYYEHEYSHNSNLNGTVVDYVRKYCSDLRYSIHCHEIENVIGWCYASDIQLLNVGCVLN